MIALQSAFPNWDAATHDGQRFDHGVTGIIVVPENAAAPLLAPGGYRKATQSDLASEVAVLEARIAQLKSL